MNGFGVGRGYFFTFCFGAFVFFFDLGVILRREEREDEAKCVGR